MRKFIRCFNWLTLNKLSYGTACLPGRDAFHKAFPIGAPTWFVLFCLWLNRKKKVPGTGTGTGWVYMRYEDYIGWILNRRLWKSHY